MTIVYSRAQIKQFGVEKLANGQLVGGKQLEDLSQWLITMQIVLTTLQKTLVTF